MVMSLNAWIIHLSTVEARSLPGVDTLLVNSGDAIRDAARRRVTGFKHLPAYPRAITKDLYHLPGTSRMQVGPDKELRQGALGNIVEFGTIHNAPIPHLNPALDAEAPKFEAALALMGERLLAGPDG
jgi:hypothetical protein